MTEKDQLQSATSRLPDTVKAEAYRDLAQPAARRIGRWLGALCGRLDKYSAKMEAENQAAVDTILKHYASVPTEFRTNPKPQITYAAEQAFCLSTGEPELQQLFVNLIKSCCDSRTAHGVLPSFVQIISQLTPDEAKILKYLFSDKDMNGRAPVIKLRADFQDLKKGGNDLTGPISSLYWKAKCEFPNNGTIYLDNLQRLKLVNVDMTSHFTDLNLYRETECIVKIDDYIKRINEVSDRKLTIIRGIIKLTDFGLALCVACDIQNDSQEQL